MLHERHGQVIPRRCDAEHTGGGNIDVVQPVPDTVVITMSGVAVASGHPFKRTMSAQDFDMSQCFEVVMDKTQLKPLKLTMLARVVGLLRSHCLKKGCAEESAAVTLSCGPTTLAALNPPSHETCHGDNLSVNDHDGPKGVPVRPASTPCTRRSASAGHERPVQASLGRVRSGPGHRSAVD